MRVLVRVSFVDFDTGGTDLGAVAPIAESTVARCVTDRHSDSKMSCEAVERGQNEQPLKILPRISLKFPDVQTISPINLTNFEYRLKVDYVLNGLRFGFHRGFQPHLCKLKSAASNCSSANEHPSVIDENLNKETKLVLVEFFGPTHAPPLQNLHVSRFGVIPKKGNACKLILDLSFPIEHSVNDGIDKDDFSFQYCTVKHAIKLIIKTSKGALMGKVTLPFGLRSAPGTFNNVADLFEWMLVHNWSVEDLLHYLDDYFTLGAAGTDLCAKRLAAIHQAARLVGIPLSTEKCEGPTTRMVFLGIELDSNEMSARLPADKLADLMVLLREWGSKKSYKPKALQSLLGKLNHACAVIPCGQTFTRRLIDLLRGSPRSRPFLRLNKQCQLDIARWQEFLPS